MRTMRKSQMGKIEKYLAKHGDLHWIARRGYALAPEGFGEKPCTDFYSEDGILRARIIHAGVKCFVQIPDFVVL